MIGNLLVHLPEHGPRKFLKYEVFWWISVPLGSLNVFSWVVLTTTLSIFLNMQISATIIQILIFFNIVQSIHDNVAIMVSKRGFSWSRIAMITLKILKDAYFLIKMLI